MHSLFAFCFAGLVALSAPLSAALPAQGSAKAKAELFSRTEGDSIRAAIRIRIDPGWHLYHEELGDENAIGIATQLTFTGDGITWSKPRFPAPIKGEQPVGKDGGPAWVYEHKGTLVIYVLGRSSVTPPPEWSLAIKGLTCEDAGSCIPYSAKLTGPGERGPDDVFASFPADLKFAEPAAAAPADEFKPFEDPSAHAKVELTVREVDGEARAAIRIALDRHWHLYHTELGPEDAAGAPTTLVLGGPGIEWGAPVWPTPIKIDQPVGKFGDPTWIYGHEGKLTIYARGKLEAGASVEGANLSIDGLTCEEQCIEFEARVRSSGKGDDAVFTAFPASASLEPAAPAANDATEPDNAAHDESSIDWDALTFDEYTAREDADTRSLGAWLFFAFIAGMLLNVMPCVLPVLSIKILSFVQQAGEHKSRVLALGIAFAAGILIVFIALAALAAFAGQGWGDQFQSEAFKITMVAIVFAFSLSLFDVFEIGVPSKVGEFASIKREGLGDALFKGIMSTVLATPCSGPFLGSTLAWALGQPPLVVFAVFITVGLGMAAPYVLLTANPGLLKFLPKPGAWMQTFKHAMGFVMLATVVFLMMSVRQDNLLFTVLMLVFVALGCWWWGKYATFEQSSFQRWRTLAVSLVIAGVGAWFAFGPFRGALTGESNVAWEEFDPVALAEYRDDGRPVLIDFTADWCMNCQTNKVFVYQSDRVAKLLERKGVVPIEADRTHDSPRTSAIIRLHEKLGSSSIPFLAIFPPGEDFSQPYVFRDLVTVGEVAEALERLPDAP